MCFHGAERERKRWEAAREGEDSEVRDTWREGGIQNTEKRKLRDKRADDFSSVLCQRKAHSQKMKTYIAHIYYTSTRGLSLFEVLIYIFTEEPFVTHQKGPVDDVARCRGGTLRISYTKPWVGHGSVCRAGEALRDTGPRGLGGGQGFLK